MQWQQATITHFCAYTTYLYKYVDVSVKTIRTKLSALVHHYKIHLNHNPVYSTALSKLLKAYSKEQTHDNRKPISSQILHKLLTFIPMSSANQYYKDAFYVIYVFMYKMALRISEIANYSRHFDHAIGYQDVYMDLVSNHLVITIRSAKHAQEPKIYNMRLYPRLKLIYNRFISARGTTIGPLFIHRNASHFSRSFILKTLRKHLFDIGENPSLYNTHSFRIGRTSDLARQGRSDRQIADIGRWSSNAFHTYIRPPPTQV